MPNEGCCQRASTADLRSRCSVSFKACRQGEPRFCIAGIWGHRRSFHHADEYLSRAFGQACNKLGLKHIKTKPYTPKTNGKAERFIQTSLREWAYARAYDSSDERTAELPRWLHNYNWHRPHGSIASKPPISRLALDRNNLLRLHS